jgi:ferrous iron transport protein B
MELSSVLWTGCIAYTLNRVIFYRDRMQTVERTLPKFLAIVFGVPLALTLLPLLQGLRTPQVLSNFLVYGVWLGVSTVMSFLPIIFIFYLMLAIVEDSGYLPRAAFLMDGFMHWLGLDGRAFVLQVMGFGCNVPAIMGTRVIRDRGMRLLAMLVIPFALCQARLTVFVFMAAVFFPKPWWAPGLVVFGFYLMSFAAAIITGLLFKRAYPNREAFVLELPPYRKPSLQTMLRRAWREMTNFMVTTRGFIVGGAAMVWLLTNLPPQMVAGAGPTVASRIGTLFDPLLAPIGMTPDLTVALIFGFIAKEIVLGGLAVIYARHPHLESLASGLNLVLQRGWGTA